MVTIANVLEKGWSSPNESDPVLALVQVRDYVLIITHGRIWQARGDETFFVVDLIGHH